MSCMEEEQMNLFKRIRNTIKRWLERLGEANREQFGDSPPDCCDLNRPKKEGKP